MLYAISRELDAALKAQHVPIPVVFGPDITAVGIDERIVIDYRGPSADSIEGPISVHRNPQMPMRRVVGATLRIYARAGFTGAAWHDHAERAEKILDHVLCELDAITRKRRNALTWGAGGFIVLEEEDGAELTAGAVYELAFEVDRGVYRTTWEGDAREEIKIGPPPDVPIVSTTKVSDDPPPAGTPPPDAETAC